ncbi:MAG: UDP-glucose 4-epimerase GalE [Bacteroidia bacterium]|nr:UDP-glucose 4-epimerase GalE [Bacteroidia bacterium]
MKKKVLVTGSTGFIGSHTMIELLEGDDYEPIGIDNFSNSFPEVNERIKRITGKNFRHYNLDICRADDLENALKNEGEIFGIIHFAAFKSVGESCEKPDKYYINNLNGLVNMLEICKKLKIQKFIFSSSCSVYGNADHLPVTEQTPLKFAESPYAHTKSVGEEIIRQYARLFPQSDYILLRYFNPVGAHISAEIGEFPIQKPSNLFPVITQTAAGINELIVHGNDYPTRDGTCIRDYVHVSDIANAHVLALKYEVTEKKMPEIFNLGSGTGYTVMEVIKAFLNYTGQPLPYTIGPRRNGDVIAIYADNTKARKLLGWNCRYTLKDMIITAWNWQKNLLKKT